LIFQAYDQVSMTNMIRLVGWPKRCNLSPSLPNSPKEI